MQKDDLISRQAAKDYIDTQKGRPFIGCTIGEAMKIMIDEVPTAPEPTGHWILKDHLWECDNCGFRINVAHPSNSDYHYCSNCGAHMIEEDK